MAGAYDRGMFAPPPPPPALALVSTEHVGKWDASCREAGLSGTDLGISFERDGRLVFLFGDSWTLDKKDWDCDSAATCGLDWSPGKPLPALEFAAREGGRFQPLLVQGVDLGGMNVPVEGLAIGERTYVFFDSGFDRGTQRHTTSVLAHVRGLDFTHLERDHAVASERFLNVSAVIDGTTVWIFGSGAYRRSAIHLACVASAKLADRAAWRYLGKDGAWVEHEADAIPLIERDDVGELSVRRVDVAGAKGAWLLAYQAKQPRGVLLQVARAPTGPWSPPLRIFDPGVHGYGRFMHRACKPGEPDDGLGDPGRAATWGGEYGPYLVPRWSGPIAGGRTAIAYTLSSWNPYAVHVMRTIVEPASSSPEK